MRGRLLASFALLSLPVGSRSCLLVLVNGSLSQELLGACLASNKLSHFSYSESWKDRGCVKPQRKVFVNLRNMSNSEKSKQDEGLTTFRFCNRSTCQLLLMLVSLVSLLAGFSFLFCRRLGSSSPSPQEHPSNQTSRNHESRRAHSFASSAGAVCGCSPPSSREERRRRSQEQGNTGQERSLRNIQPNETQTFQNSSMMAPGKSEVPPNNGAPKPPEKPAGKPCNFFIRD